MPVPVASTHAKGKGLDAAKFSELETEGPFARLKASAASAAPSEPAADAAPAVATPTAAQSESASSVSSFALETHNLSFKYPGIGTTNCLSHAALISSFEL